MKKTLLVVATIAILIWVASWFRAEDAVSNSAGITWPGALGPLSSAPERFPSHPANAAALQLTALGKALPKNDAVDEFVRREIARGTVSIGQPPRIHEAATIRTLLLGAPVVWQRYSEFDSPAVAARREIQVRIARLLVATALIHARENDPAAWEYLHAAWNLTLSLDEHPQMMEQTAALTIARMINGVAWKLPLPAPAWLHEVENRDNVQRLIEAYQYQTSSYWKDGARIFPTKWLAASIEHDRAIAGEIAATTRCDVRLPMNELGVDLTSVWSRAFRFRAEREATANALRVREGNAIETKSQCTDGAWSFDGKTLRFSHEIPSNGNETPPLTLRMEP
jgi:hypothetical protein